jgi:hypothetical protein
VPIVVRQKTSSTPSTLKNSAAVRGKPGGVASSAPATKNSATNMAPRRIGCIAPPSPSRRRSRRLPST